MAELSVSNVSIEEALASLVGESISEGVVGVVASTFVSAEAGIESVVDRVGAGESGCGEVVGKIPLFCSASGTNEEDIGDEIEVEDGCSGGEDED